MNRHFGIISALFLVLLALTGCSQSVRAGPYVDLNNLQPIAPAGYAVEDVAPLRVAVAAIISPQGTVESYRPLLDYLGEQLHRPVELVQRRTYAEVNDMIQRNEVDLAFVCTRAYVQGQRDFGMELLAIPQVQGDNVYYSKVIVRANLPMTRFEDLTNTVFAFTDPLSNTGHLYPSVLLKQLGVSPDDFFQRTFFTYSHDNAINAVAEGVADAAAVDSLVLDYALARDPDLQGRLRVIHTSPAFGMPPVVVGQKVRPQTKARLNELLLGIADDPQGRLALQALDIDRFLPAHDDDYDPVRRLEQDLEMP